MTVERCQTTTKTQKQLQRDTKLLQRDTKWPQSAAKLQQKGPSASEKDTRRLQRPSIGQLKSKATAKNGYEDNKSDYKAT